MRLTCSVSAPSDFSATTADATVWKRGNVVMRGIGSERREGGGREDRERERETVPKTRCGGLRALERNCATG